MCKSICIFLFVHVYIYVYEYPYTRIHIHMYIYIQARGLGFEPKIHTRVGYELKKYYERQLLSLSDLRVEVCDGQIGGGKQASSSDLRVMSCYVEKGKDKDQSISDLQVECCYRQKRIDTEESFSDLQVEGCGGEKGNAKEKSKEVNQDGAGLEGKDQENGNVGGTEEEVRAGLEEEEEEEEEERDVHSEQEEVFRDKKRVGRGVQKRKEECLGWEKGIRVRGLRSQNYVRLSDIYVYVSS